MSDPANLGIYKGVLIGLIIGTIVTVAVSGVELGTAGNVILGLIIAVAKATLVVLFFMHLKYEPKWWYGLVIFPVVLVMIIIFSNFPDTAMNMAEGDKFGNGLTTPAVEKTPGVGASGAH